MLDLSGRGCIVPGMSGATGTAAKRTTMLDVGKSNEANLSATRHLLTRLALVREHLCGAQPPVNGKPEAPSMPGLVEAFAEDAAQQAQLLAWCREELDQIEEALSVPKPDRVALAERDEPRLGGSVEGVAMAPGPSRPLGGRYA